MEGKAPLRRRAAAYPRAAHMIVLGADPGLSTGLALYQPEADRVVWSGKVDLRPLWRERQYGAAACQLASEVRRLLLVHLVDAVCIEEPQQSHGRQKGKAAGAVQSHDTFAIALQVAATAEDCGVPCYWLAVNSIRKAALGFGGADKAAAHLALARLGHKLPNIHGRDAAIAAMAGVGAHRRAEFERGMMIAKPARKRA